MAKTIMISNEVYGELKAIKGDKSFSEILKGFLDSDDKKRGSGLRDCLGILKEDKEWKKVKKELNKGWNGWNKRYA